MRNKNIWIGIGLVAAIAPGGCFGHGVAHAHRLSGIGRTCAGAGCPPSALPPRSNPPPKLPPRQKSPTQPAETAEPAIEPTATTAPAGTDET